MKILSITAGAAGMYCGSCLRDNALAIELMARGHDVTLVPVYTPTLTDDKNVSRPEVLFGGISVYLQQHVSMFRTLPRVFDRLWDSPWVIGTFAGRGISPDAKFLGEMTISSLQGESGVLRREFDKLVEWTKDEPVPDVINLPNSLLIAMAAPLKRALKRPVCVTLQGDELFIDGLVPPYREQALTLIRRQVREVDTFIAVSDYCARFMTTYLEIPSDRIAVVPLGISMDGYGPPNHLRQGYGGPPKPSAKAEGGPYVHGSHLHAPHVHGPQAPFRVGYLARIAPEKGLRLLAEGYVRLRQRMSGAPARLDVAGYMAPDQRAYLEGARAVLAKAGLQDEMTYRGEVDWAGKRAFLSELDVLSVPATYDEPKGLFLLEALASGVPVVQPRRGAFIEVVERTGGGMLVAPDDPDALAAGLHALWADGALRERLGRTAYEGVRQHYTIAHSADRLIAAYESLTRAGESNRTVSRDSVSKGVA
jgi:glycosyltransferase involved in cell wall biosynthesis